MTYGVYSVRDKKSVDSEFYSPRVEVSDDAAIRWFCSVVNTPGTMTNFAPEDFSLWKIGEFDCKTGVISGLVDLVFLTRGDSIIKVDKPVKKGTKNAKS